MTAKGKTKALAAALLCAVLVVAAAGWMLRGGVSPVRAEAIRIASATLGVPVSIDAVSIDAAAGVVVLRGVKIANPPGHGRQSAIIVDRIHMSARSLGPGLYHFGDVAVNGLSVTLEATAAGTNLSALRRSINAAATNGESVRTIVKRADIADARLQAVVTPDGGPGGTITLPDMVLRGIGEKDDGISASAAIAQVADHVIRVASQAAGQAGYYRGMPPETLRAMQEQLGLSQGILETAIGIVKKDVQELSGGIRKMIEDGAAPPQQAPAQAE